MISKFSKKIEVALGHLISYDITESPVFSTRYNTQIGRIKTRRLKNSRFLSVVAGTKYGGFRYNI